MRQLASFLILMGALFGGVPAFSQYQPLPDDPEEQGFRVTTIERQEGDRFTPWHLGFALSHGAVEGDFVRLKRNYWRPLARGLETAEGAPEGFGASVSLGHHEVLVVTEREGSIVRQTLYLPEGVLLRDEGPWTLALGSSFDRQRTSTREVTTWPLKLDLEYSRESTIKRTHEVSVGYERSLIREKVRESISTDFRDVESETIQDTQAAALGYGTYWNLARETAVGRVDLGLNLGVEWERDPLNFLENRLVTFVGGQLRMKSESVDDLGFEVGLRLGGTFEDYRFEEEMLSDSGEVIGIRLVEEEIQLPTAELVLKGEAPLYRLDNTTILKLKFQLSWLESFEKAGGDEGRPEEKESIRLADVGLSVSLPMGGTIGFSARVAEYRIPGLAGENIEKHQWKSGAVAAYSLTF